MLHNLFRRREDGGTGGNGPGPVLASHILAKFLKRLQAKERPCLLDLGHLSGSNIEFFARARCKVQVDDLLHPAEAAAGDAAERAGGATAAPGPDPAPVPDSAAVPQVTAASDAPGPATMVAGLRTNAGRIGTAIPGPPARPGARPTRRIVLPPRTFGRPQPGPTGAGLSGPSAARQAAGIAPVMALPLAFPYPDESFDAIVAWDIFNFYDNGSIRGIAAEVRRVLRPGGLLLTYFHARLPQAPDVPRRFRILDDKRVVCDPAPGRALRRHLYQNRDIEKLFTGLTIVELYFLKNSMREILMEKKAAASPERRPAVRVTPRKTPRFVLE